MKTFDPRLQEEVREVAGGASHTAAMSAREGIAALLIAGARADGSVSRTPGKARPC